MTPTDDADRFLVESIRRGDQRAWHLLIQRYQGRLLAFARSRLTGGQEAEDAVQETFLGFLTSLTHYDESRSLETYLFAIVRYKIHEALSKRKRQPQAAAGFDSDEDGPAWHEPSDPETPSRAAVRREHADRQVQTVSSILRRLIEEYRDRDKLDDLRVIELLFYAGQRNKEAAEILGRDEKSVAGVKFRALARLREFLDELKATEGESVIEGDLSEEADIARVWRQRRLSCLKRSSIGMYLLGVMEEPWLSYTRFHLDTVQCPMCRANVEDLASERAQTTAAPGLTERTFQSSVGFLSHVGA